MTFVTLAVLVVIATVSTVWLARTADASRTPVFALAVLPLTLLFLTAPSTAAVYELIRGFERIGRTGESGADPVRVMARTIATAVAFGGLGALTTLALAGLLQM